MEAVTTHPITITTMALALRLVVAFAFGAVVGIERQWHHKNAGIRTHALVAVGAAAFGLLSLLGFGATNNPMLIAAGVVTGIGFIGGGVIMRRGATVQGINTAATLWATASMGLALGGGYYALASLAFVAVLASQFPLRWADHWMERRFPSEIPILSYRLRARMLPSAAEAAQSVWGMFVGETAAEVKSLATHRENDEVLLEADFGIQDTGTGALVTFNNALAGIPGMQALHLERVTTSEAEE